MRRALLFRNRVDFVATLLQQGQLVDMPILQHFTSREPHAPAAGGDGGVGRCNDTSSVCVTRAPQDTLLSKCEAVRERTKTGAALDATLWLTGPSATTEWRAFSHSREAVQATVSASDPASVTLRGNFLAVGQEGSSPAVVRLVASKGGSEGGAVLLTVPLAQSSEKVCRSVVGDGLHSVTLTEAKGSILGNSAAADEFAVEQNVLGAAACSGIIGKLEEICALHATHAVRYDALLIRNPSVQKRLSQLACARFGIDALNSFIIGCSEGDQSQKNRLPVSLVESFALGLYAKRALATSMANARAIMGSTSGMQAEQHRSKPSRLIDYPLATNILDSERRVLSNLDGNSTVSQIMRHFAPLLAVSRVNANREVKNPLMSLLLRDNGSVRIAAPHVYLQVSTTALEKDITEILYRIQAQKERGDSLFVTSVAQYISEVFANLAVVYRATASLAREEASGPRNWLIAQAFCAESSAERKTLLRDLDMWTAARQAVYGCKDINSCTMHPVELMNVQPVPNKKPEEVEAKN